MVNKYNNTYNGTIKLKPVDVKSNRYIKSGKEINNKDNKFKFGLLEYQNMKTFCKSPSSKLVWRSYCD